MANDMKQLKVNAENGSFTFEVIDQEARDAAKNAQDAVAEIEKVDLTGYATEEFVKNKIAEAKLAGSDVDLSGYAEKKDIPTKTSQLTNDSGYLTGYTETDPTVPAWAKKASKPSYTAAEVGARPSTWTPSASDVGADPSGTAASKISEHNTADGAHNDIRLLITGLTNRLNALADSDDTTLDQLSELVAYIKDNRELIEGITTDKVNVTDIINNLTTNATNKPLSAAQGVALKALIDAIKIPTTLPNPQKLIFNGGATGEYDGSTEVTITIPEGSSGPIKYHESLDRSNPAFLRDLESGSYVLYGYYKPFEGSSTNLTFDGLLANVVNISAGSHILVFSTLNSKVDFLAIEVDSTQTGGYKFERTNMSLLNLNALIAKVGNLSNLSTTEKSSLVAAINEVAAAMSGYATEEFVTNKIAEAELGGEEVDLSGYAQKSEIPTKVSQLQNDKGYLSAVPDGYAKTADIPTKPSDIGAQPEGDYALRSEIPSVPVKSVNGKTGAVTLGASDVKARADSWMPTAAQVGADPAGTGAASVSAHNTDTDAHNDLRLELKAISDRLTAFFDSDDTTLDELSEIVAYITSNKTLIESITTSKVSVTDIVNNLTTNVSNKPLSAAQGVVLKGLIDTLSGNLANYQPKGNYALRSELPTVPTKVSQLQNDSGFQTVSQVTAIVQQQLGVIENGTY